MVNHLHHCKQSQKIWGCRHQILGINNCFQYVNKQADMLCDRYEPVSQAVSGERERERCITHYFMEKEWQRQRENYIKHSLFYGEGMTILHKWINI